MARLMNTERVEITSPFGPRTDPVTGAQSTHSGIDLVGRPSIGTNPTILCHTTGIVTCASYSATWGYYVDIRVSNSAFMRYAHMQANLKVKLGQTVYQGEEIGIMGATGKATGVHLHFGISINKQWIDPRPYLEEDIVDMTEADVRAIIEKVLKEKAQQNPANNAESLKARQWAEKEGIVKGSDRGNMQYGKLVTKEEVVLMISRAHDVK